MQSRGSLSCAPGPETRVVAEAAVHAGPRRRPRRRARSAAAPTTCPSSAFQRFGPPGIRCPLSAACATSRRPSPATGDPSSAPARSGSTSSSSSARSGAAIALADAHVVEHAVVVVEAEQQRTDAFAVLVHPETRDDAVARALVLHLQHRALAGLVGSPSGFATTPSKPAPSKRSNHSARGRDSGRRREVERRQRIASNRSSPARRSRNGSSSNDSSPSARRSNTTYDAGISAASLLHARRGRVLAQLQRVEVEAGRRRDHELAVKNDLLRELLEQRLAQLGEVTQQWLLVAALQVEVVAVAEQDAAEAVPLRLVDEIGPAWACRGSSLASIGSNGGRTGNATEPKLLQPSSERAGGRRPSGRAGAGSRAGACAAPTTRGVSTVFTEIPRSRATSLYA